MLETPLMTRRRFFQALAASVAVAGLPLPVGMPYSAVEPLYQYGMSTPWDLSTMFVFHTSVLAKRAVAVTTREEFGRHMPTIGARTETAF